MLKDLKREMYTFKREPCSRKDFLSFCRNWCRAVLKRWALQENVCVVAMSQAGKGIKNIAIQFSTPIGGGTMRATTRQKGRFSVDLQRGRLDSDITRSRELKVR